MEVRGVKTRLQQSVMGVSMLLIVLSATNNTHAANVSGTFGYLQGTAGEVVCDTNDAPTDISATGTVIVGSGQSGTSLGDDEEVIIPIPFSFAFYGVVYNSLTIANNGGVLFGASPGPAELPASNVDLPTANLSHPAILPFWDDLDDERGDVYYEARGSSPYRIFHVQWDRPHFSDVGDARIKMIFYETFNSIMFSYPDIDFGNAAFNDGVGATAGIQKNSGEAIKTAFNESITTKLNGSLVECFEPRSVIYEFAFEKASATPACATPMYPDEGPLQVDDGEEVRFCLIVNNYTTETLTSHKVTIPGGSDVKTQSIPPGATEVIHFSGPIQNSISVPVSITSYGGAVAEGDFENGTIYQIETGSILDLLPAILSGALKKN